ncbi:hypothetical protein BE17_23570 [Sorangium cellulosum]|uniref:Uncharacterized protein n=1 Tax=Sorangium cellulosum TaxID=56 RepID=A0A150R6L4_SORCE|nr:hypothetical protein BE17_23570 [Sorangium cellulosum]
MAPMNFNIRDPKHRMTVTFPGKPVTRDVSPDDIEAYLRSKGYEAALLADRNWPKDVAYSWWPPRRPDPRAPPFHIRPAVVRGLRECCKPLEQAIETIASNEGRTPGEVLREIAVMAQIAEWGSVPQATGALLCREPV